MDDTIIEGALGVREKRVVEGIYDARTAGTESAAKNALASAVKDVQTLIKQVRTEEQKALLLEYFVEAHIQRALGDAALVKLLENEDVEIVLKAAKELRGKQERGGVKVDKAVFVQREDPQVTELKGALDSD
jgi:hypothetical protein